MSTSRKTVLITGCSAGGIGDALAREFHRRGLHVIATARRLDAMKGLVELGIQALQLDVTDEESVRQARNEVATMTGGRLDVLVNNAGQACTSAATDLTLAKIKAVFDVNVFGVMSMVREFIHLLIASGDGRIVQIGSISAIMPIPFGSAYNATKAALHAYGNTLRIELAPFNVKVVTVVTGGVKSNISKPSSIPKDSLYRPMEAQYQARRVNMSQNAAMDTDAYAKAVVSETLSRHPRAWFWAGSYTWAAWILNTFIGKRIFDWILTKRFGLSELPSMVNAGKVKDI